MPDTVTTSTPASAPASTGTATAEAPTTAPATPASSSTPAATPSATTSTKPDSPRGKSYDQVLKPLDELFGKAAADKTAAKPAEQTPAVDEKKVIPETPKAKPDGSAEEAKADEKPAEEKTETSIEDDERVPLKIREAAKLIAEKDKALGKLIVEDHFLAKAYKNSGMPVSEIKEYKQIAPSVDDLRLMKQNSDLALAMSEDYVSPDPNGMYRFVQALASSPDSYTGLAGVIAENLENVNRPAYYGVAERSHRNSIANLRAEAERTGNNDFAVAADIMAEFLGFQTPDGRPVAPQGPTVSPEIAARLQEADALREQLMQQQQAQQQQAVDGFISEGYGTAYESVGNTLKGVIDERAEGYTDRAKEKLFDKVMDGVRQGLTSNSAVAARIESVLAQGFTPDTHKQMTAIITQAAQSLLPFEVEREFTELAEMIGPVIQKREQQVQRQLATREVGSGGGVPLPEAKPLTGKGKTYDQLFEESGLFAKTKR